jgi:hypothetical protein
MKVFVNKDTKFLTANSDHKNFTETDEIAQAETMLEGNNRNVAGLRRGKPFTYRVFITNDNKILYQNNITPMRTTEVMLGADDSSTTTTVNLRPAETFNRVRTYGIVIGAVAGFAYAKYKKHDLKKVAMFMALGSLAGYAGGYLVDTNRKATVKQTK